MKQAISPITVPAATMRKPWRTPQTTPQRMMTISAVSARDLAGFHCARQLTIAKQRREGQHDNYSDRHQPSKSHLQHPPYERHEQVHNLSSAAPPSIVLTSRWNTATPHTPTANIPRRIYHGTHCHLTQKRQSLARSHVSSPRSYSACSACVSPVSVLNALAEPGERGGRGMRGAWRVGVGVRVCVREGGGLGSVDVVAVEP